MLRVLLSLFVLVGFACEDTSKSDEKELAQWMADSWTISSCSDASLNLTGQTAAITSDGDEVNIQITIADELNIINGLLTVYDAQHLSISINSINPASSSLSTLIGTNTITKSGDDQMTISSSFAGRTIVFQRNN